jgi:hypothetical protein
MIKTGKVYLLCQKKKEKRKMPQSAIEKKVFRYRSDNERGENENINNIRWKLLKGSRVHVREQ